MLNNTDLKDKVLLEYSITLQKWHKIQEYFDFQRKTLHNIHLKSTLRDMYILLDRLQMLAFLLEKWDDN